MFFKTSRKIDKQARKLKEAEYCVGCGKRATEKHHLKSRGSGGGDEPWNLIPIESFCHENVHKIGLTAFAEKYESVKNWLLAMGWYYDDFRKKWSK